MRLLSVSYQSNPLRVKVGLLTTASFSVSTISPTFTMLIGICLLECWKSLLKKHIDLYIECQNGTKITKSPCNIWMCNPLKSGKYIQSGNQFHMTLGLLKELTLSCDYLQIHAFGKKIVQGFISMQSMTIACSVRQELKLVLILL